MMHDCVSLVEKPVFFLIAVVGVPAYLLICLVNAARLALSRR
jgi:hypothetical protein